jgi:5-methyltetrahydropteroyltriglutamate--homocysteine methyltransferase
MPLYEKYATTVIGAHSVPDWYEPLDRLVAVGQLSMSAVADAQFRASQAAILEQELAAIDVVTGGEMHRRTHNRHSPPNAMLNHFWQQIPAFQGATRPKPITNMIPTSSTQPPLAGPGSLTISTSASRRISNGVGVHTQAG